MRIPTSTLDAIKLEHNDTPDKCLLHMLQHWLSQLSPPSFRDMIRVLSSEPIGEECLASTLERQVYGHSTANDGTYIYNTKILLFQMSCSSDCFVTKNVTL